MADAFRPDGQLNVPTQAAADKLDELGISYDDYMFEQKFGMPRDEYTAKYGTFDKSMTPTRDRLSLFAQEIGMPADAAGRMFGGAGQGFMDMGLIDIPFVGGALDAIDAYNRLEKTKEEDNFSDNQERLIQGMPFAMKVASILMPGDNYIKEYYDGKKMDIATLYGGPLGFLGVSSATGRFLSNLSRKVDDAPIMGQTIKKMMPDLGGLPDEVPYHMMPEYRAADPDAAIKGDKYANVFEAANRKFKGEDYDE